MGPSLLLLMQALTVLPSAWTVRADVYASDVQPANLRVVVGSPTFLAELSAGAGQREQFVAGTGVGLHFGDRLWLEPVATLSILQALSGQQETDLLMQLRVLFGVLSFEHLGFFLGPTGNLQLSFAPNPILRGSALNPWRLWGRLRMAAVGSSGLGCRLGCASDCLGPRFAPAAVSAR